MSVLILILLSLSTVYADSHSLRYYTIGVTAPGSGLPEFYTVGYVDDQPIELYTSDIRKLIPVAPWMKENAEYWEKRTRINREYEAVYRHEVKIMMNRFNHTGGFHFTQGLHGCELRDDGSTAGYQEYRYDGREYMFLDTQTWTYIPTMAEAQIITQKWNSPEVRKGEWEKNNLENICINTLKRFIENGREDLERRVRPEVKVKGRESGGVTKLHCQVYGFYPRAVDVKWMKNGTDEVLSFETRHVLPNPDGTYQIRVTVEVIPQEGDSYYCYVDHSSLEEPLLVKWEAKEDSRLAVIVSAVIIVLVLTSVATGIIIYKKKKNNYTLAGEEEMRKD